MIRRASYVMSAKTTRSLVWCIFNEINIISKEDIDIDRVVRSFSTEWLNGSFNVRDLIDEPDDEGVADPLAQIFSHYD